MKDDYEIKITVDKLCLTITSTVSDLEMAEMVQELLFAAVKDV